ncbi:MAG: UDP-N-acetylglucosamine 2-epimerase [Lachnospira sp.]|nr:UDP-N-acetylglucosamine 2-epimerase [Lachnospira sp.]
MKKILFITGTRADYGKIKSLIKSVEKSPDFEAYVYVSGMHLLEQYGSTYNEVLKDNYSNVYVAFGQHYSNSMSYNLGNVICDLTGYISNAHNRPDMIVVHGDRIDALAGAIVGAFNNILVAHIEGGELSGTIDDSTRHAITKFAHLHLVCNDEAKQRLIQLGEDTERIHIIGSPDIDLMLSSNLPDIDNVLKYYDIPFDKYGILMYHPVTTEHNQIGEHIKAVVDAVIESKKNYIVIYPNNDYGTEIILNEYLRLENRDNFRIFPSIRFEYFLTLMKHADFMIGNSSAGIRETGLYGIPAIDIGTRQKNRYSTSVSTNIQWVSENVNDICNAITHVDEHRKECTSFGSGTSTEKFMKILYTDIWNTNLQKHFHDLHTDATL